MTKRTLLQQVNVAELSKGIHDNMVISDIDVKERRRSGEASKKMIYIKFAKVDPTRRTRLKESEVSWWKPEPVNNKYFQDNLLELCYQLTTIMEVYVSAEEVNTAFEDIFKSFGVTSVAEIKGKTWKKSDLTVLLPDLSERFMKVMTPFIGVDSKLLTVKITTNHKGMGTEIPKYGAFMHAMTEEPTTLKFSKGELKNHSNSGITANK